METTVWQSLREKTRQGEHCSWGWKWDQVTLREQTNKGGKDPCEILGNKYNHGHKAIACSAVADLITACKASSGFLFVQKRTQRSSLKMVQSQQRQYQLYKVIKYFKYQMLWYQTVPRTLRECILHLNKWENHLKGDWFQQFGLQM